MGTFLEQIFVSQGVFSEGGKKQSSDCMISVVFSIFHILANNLTPSLIYTNMCVFLTRFSEFPGSQDGEKEIRHCPCSQTLYKTLIYMWE